MKEQKKRDPYANLELREQIYLECRAMTEYSLANGETVPASVISTIETFKEGGQNKDSAGNTNSKQILEKMIAAHDTLSAIIKPAKPRTILLLDMEQETSGFWRFLGPVALVRQMMVAAIISVILFFATVLTPEVNTTGGNILSSDGLPLFLNLLFYVAAAGLGASFSALYMANGFITGGTFDPAYQSSYWIRFFLGLISGLVLAIVISENAFNDTTNLLEEGIVRPLLAMLGGFSADLFYTFLNRFVETCKSLFQGSATSIIEGKKQEMQMRAATAQVQSQMKLAADVMKVQQTIGTDASPEEIKQQLNQLLGGLIPNVEMPQS